MNFFDAAPPAKKTARELVSVYTVMQYGVGPKKLTVTCRLKAAFHSPHSAALHSGLALPYGVKQAEKRQAKQCTALFCPHPLTINN
jgi:hypothetical protein